MKKRKVPNAPYVQASFQKKKQRPTAIIVRPTFTSSGRGSALGIAEAWHKGRCSPSFWSAGHYVVDEKSRFRTVKDNVIAGEGFENRNAILIAVCATSVSDDTFWDVERHGLVMDQLTTLVAELTLHHKIKVRPLDRNRWQKFRSKRRGGIQLLEASGWLESQFIEEVKLKRKILEV